TTEMTIRLPPRPRAAAIMCVARAEIQASQQELDALKHANTLLRKKVAELEAQRQVLSSGAVITLVLDAQLRVCWFTPATRALFPLIAMDVGRPITDLAQRFEDAHFTRDVDAVIQTAEPREAEVRNGDGRWFSRCIRPYKGRNGAGEITTGAAITFLDIS